MTNFLDSAHLSRKLTIVEQRLRLIQSKETIDSTNYELTRWVLFKLKIMRLLGRDEGSCRKVEAQYWRLPNIRKKRIEQCIENGRTREAIEILKESRALDVENSRLVIGYCRQIRELYRGLGEMDSCRREARNILQYVSSEFLEDFRAWKVLCSPEEGEIEREKVFASIKNNSIRNELYFEEKLLDRLMDSLMESTTEWELVKYEKPLKSLYPDRLLAWYEANVRQRAVSTSSREHYADLANTLLHMHKYPNGKERANAIVNEWRVVYKRRSAMMEELKKKGLYSSAHEGLGFIKS